MRHTTVKQRSNNASIEYVNIKEGYPEHAAEGGWSPEAIERARKIKFEMYDIRTKVTTLLIGVDAVDIQPNPYEIKIQTLPTGKREIIDRGYKTVESPSEKSFLKI